MNWKKHIHALREAGMTLEQIAEAMGVSTSAIYELLAGRTKSPRADAAIRLLNLSPARSLAEASAGAVSRHELRPDSFGSQSQQKEASHA